MFVAMNVFTCGDEASAKMLQSRFENRTGAVEKQPGFVEFAFLKCVEDPKKMISVTHWRSKEDFEAWTNSPAFAAAHPRPAGGSKPAGPPPKIESRLETYEVVPTAPRA